MKAGLTFMVLLAAIAAGIHLVTLRPPRCEGCGTLAGEAHAGRAAGSLAVR